MPTTPLKAVQGPAIFVSLYLSDEAPYNTLEGLLRWASGLGFKGMQIPIDDRLIDIKKAAKDEAYCSELLSLAASFDMQLTELSSHLQGQLIAVHPAYDVLFDGFAPENLRGDPEARRSWAEEVLLDAAKASKNLGMKAHATFSGALAWPYFYPWPQRPDNLIETASEELARRWKPILDAFEDAGVDVCYELHPNEDLHDGVSFERFLQLLDNHPRACILYDPSHFLLQQLDYLNFLDIYHDRIKAFHVKDAEYRPTGRQGMYGGYSGWTERAGRTRALGDGQVDFKGIFTRLAQYGFDGWAVMEWECVLKDKFVCAAEGPRFISNHIIPVTGVAFDDFAASKVDEAGIQAMLGLRPSK